MTKFNDVNSLLTAHHNGHTRFRFSLNAPSVIRMYEHAAPPLDERVAAAAMVAQADYPLGFIIAPIFHYPDWRQEYKGLFSSLAKALPETARRDLTFEMITHRFTKRAKTNITAIFPQTTLPMPEDDRTFKFGQFGYGKYVYSLSAMAEMKTFMMEQIGQHFPEAKVEYFVYVYLSPQNAASARRFFRQYSIFHPITSANARSHKPDRHAKNFIWVAALPKQTNKQDQYI